MLPTSHEPMTVPEPCRPKLQISNLVYGREKRGSRVWYQIDPMGIEPEKGVPETVVLKRWRKRKHGGLEFCGERLSSTVWRAILHAFPEPPAALCNLSVAQLQERLEQERRGLREKQLLLPSAATMHAMFTLLGAQRIERILTRHADPARRGRSGVPDLFLYTRKPDRSYAMARFVEVKREDELLSCDQKEELGFLHSLSLKARVLRLQERKNNY